MAAHHIKLTSKRVVDDAVGPVTEQEAKRGYSVYWDTELRGFGLRVTTTEVKSFILQTRINGREKRITIGRYPGVSPTVARKQATNMLGNIAGGGDPVANRQRQRLETVTLEMAFNDYIEVKDLKPSTINDMNRSLKETFSSWRKKPITKITRRMVETCYLKRVEVSKSRANGAFRYLRAVLNLAASRYRDIEDKPILPDNPVNVLSEGGLWRKVGRRRTVLTPDGLKQWIPAVMALGDIPKRKPGTGKTFPKLRHGEVHRDLFMFLALTGCRKGEALKLEKRDLNLNLGILLFRDTKNGTDLELPITPYLRKLLERRINASPNKIIFASPHDGRVPSNFRHPIGRITAETGLNFTLHDLCRLAATSLERIGVPTYTIKAILNHAAESRDVTGGYVVVDNAMKLKALEKLERFILQHTEESGKVVSLQDRMAL